ncbi:MAG: WYL domain-containing protein, partial [Proteobacteria bacterium]|nr:WYL domain-containing protein [Pseudomonadota bacterium]
MKGRNAKGRNAQVSRILSILDLLESTPSGLSASEIHDRLKERRHHAAKRTIYRDLNALANAGFPLFPDGDGESSGRWRLERTTRVHQHLVLSAKELFALFLARGALTPLQSTPFFEDLLGIFQKLESRLGTKQLHYLRQLETEVKFEPGPAWGLGINPDILETLRSGCAEEQVIEGVYYSVNSRRESLRRLGPQYLYYALGMLYLVAEDLEAKKVKVFAVPRFRSATMLDEPYQGEIKPPEEL